MKNFIRKYVLHTQIWVSLMISCLCLFFGLLHGTVDYIRIGIVFFSTLAGYNFIDFHIFWRKNLHKKIHFLLFCIGVLFLSWFMYIEGSWLLIRDLVLLSIIVFMYNSDFLAIKFRNIYVLKIFIISFIWACFILWIGNTGPFSYMEFLIVFLFIIGITIPFDICDMKRDSIYTLPRVLGIQLSKYLAYFCLAGSAALFYFLFHDQVDFSISWVSACLVSIVSIIFMKVNNLYFYTRFWMEACSSLPLIVYLLPV